MNTTCSHRWQAVLLGAVLASTLSAGPVTAVMLHDPVLPPPSAATHAPTSRPCWLSRVGTLFVRCDNLTGNAVQAPRWVAQRSQAPYDAVTAGSSTDFLLAGPVATATGVYVDAGVKTMSLTNGLISLHASVFKLEANWPTTFSR
jgi:hypothetical protein